MAGKMFWPLPRTVDTIPRLCYQVEVPNDERHIAAFMGAIYGLSRWYNWERDETHTAKDIAEVWRDIMTKVQLCGPSTATGDDMQFRQNGCKLEYSIDCATWYTLYDPTECILKVTGQQGPADPIPTNECHTFPMVLQANQRLLLPVSVNDGNVITVTGQTGGASDGTAAWNCPDGTPYVLGACVGLPGHTTGDLSGPGYHMELLALVDGIYYPVGTDGDGFIVPAGTGEVQLEFMVNDSDLSNNSGSYQFSVEVCNTPTATWSQDFDFTADDGGWAAYANNAVYSAGVGWRNGGSATDETCYVVFTLLHDTRLTVWDAPFTTDAANIGYQGAVLTGNGVALHRDDSLADSPGGTLSYAGGYDLLAGQTIIFQINTNVATPHNTICASMHFEGVGDNPFIP